MSNSICSLLRPPTLKDGDVVGVVAPAGPVDRVQLKIGLEVIRSMGFKPLLGRHIYARSRFMAGSDKDRAQDLRRRLFSHVGRSQRGDRDLPAGSSRHHRIRRTPRAAATRRNAR